MLRPYLSPSVEFVCCFSSNDIPSSVVDSGRRQDLNLNYQLTNSLDRERPATPIAAHLSCTQWCSTGSGQVYHSLSPWPSLSQSGHTTSGGSAHTLRNLTLA